MTLLAHNTVSLHATPFYVTLSITGVSNTAETLINSASTEKLYFKKVPKKLVTIIFSVHRPIRYAKRGTRHNLQVALWQRGTGGETHRYERLHKRDLFFQRRRWPRVQYEVNVRCYHLSQVLRSAVPHCVLHLFQLTRKSSVLNNMPHAHVHLSHDNLVMYNKNNKTQGRSTGFILNVAFRYRG